jgi:hypothetical protein
MEVFEFLMPIFTEYGYLAVFVMLLICGFGVPVPEDVTLVTGGVIAGLGHADVHTMFAVGMAAAPTLQNYVERQAWRVQAAPPEHEAALRKYVATGEGMWRTRIVLGLHRLGRVFPEPARSTAQTEGVTPGVHIRAHALRTAAWHRGREQYLQVKHRIFFGEIAASVGI